MFERSLFVVSVNAPFVAVASVSGLITDEHVGFVGLLAAVVVSVAASIAWIDARIDRKIKSHTMEDKMRHNEVIKQIHFVNKIIAEEKGLPVPDLVLEDLGG